MYHGDEVKSPNVQEDVGRLRDLSVQGVNALAQIIECLPVGVYIGDESGITLCNAIGLEMIGFACVEELRVFGLGLPERLQTRDAATGERIPFDDEPFVAALNGRRCARELAYTHAVTGRDVVVHCTAVPLFEEGRVTQAIVVNSDITDRFQRERQHERDVRELRESHKTLSLDKARREEVVALLDTLLRGAPLGFAFLDREGRFRLINEPLAEMNGIPASEHLGRTVREVIPYIADAAEEILRRIQETGRPLVDQEIVGETPRAPGVERTWHESWYPVRAGGGEIVGFGVIVNEVTERKKIERSLRESEERFRTLADNMSQFAWMAEPNGTVFWHNRRWLEYTGTTQEEMQGSSWTRMLHPDHADRVERGFRHHVEQGLEWEDTYPLRGRDGRYRWFLTRAVPIRDDAGGIVRWFGTNTDVTAQREAEEEREELLARRSRVAETLQRSLLLVPLPDAFPGVTVKPLYLPASDDVQVGGDFYDVFAISEDTVALVVGDVTGKGLEAAAYTAEVKFALRAFLREYPDPGAAFRRLNRFIVDTMRLDGGHLGATYVVAAIAILNTRTGNVVSCTAGMEAPFLLRAATGEAIEMDAGGPILGADDALTYETQSERLEPGDLLAFSTDGITEARSGDVFFGYERLIDSVRGAAHLDCVGAIGREVAGIARAFANGVQRDDVCLLLARWTGRETS